MNKTITIYELLGLIKDGQAPEKIYYDNKEYTIDSELFYADNNGKGLLADIFNYFNDLGGLTETVEIIEEDKKIEKIDIVSMLLGGKEANKEFGKKINEIIDKVNSLENKQ